MGTGATKSAKGPMTSRENVLAIESSWTCSVIEGPVINMRTLCSKDTTEGVSEKLSDKNIGERFAMTISH